MKEDRLTESIMNFFGEDAECKLEVHYNDYGTRGVVDLVVERTNFGKNCLHIIECKAGNAVESCTGANEIIRQFKRHKTAFYPGTDYKQVAWDTYYELGFAASEPCLTHVAENEDLYKRIAADGNTIVSVWHPEVTGRGMPLKEDPITDTWPGREKFDSVLDDRYGFSANRNVPL